MFAAPATRAPSSHAAAAASAAGVVPNQPGCSVKGELTGTSTLSLPSASAAAVGTAGSGRRTAERSSADKSPVPAGRSGVNGAWWLNLFTRHAWGEAGRLYAFHNLADAKKRCVACDVPFYHPATCSGIYGIQDRRLSILHAVTALWRPGISELCGGCQRPSRQHFPALAPADLSVVPRWDE